MKLTSLVLKSVCAGAVMLSLAGCVVEPDGTVHPAAVVAVAPAPVYESPVVPVYGYPGYQPYYGPSYYYGPNVVLGFGGGFCCHGYYGGGFRGGYGGWRRH